jgi:hypothetical protein
VAAQSLQIGVLPAARVEPDRYVTLGPALQCGGTSLGLGLRGETCCLAQERLMRQVGCDQDQRYHALLYRAIPSFQRRAAHCCQLVIEAAWEVGHHRPLCRDAETAGVSGRAQPATPKPATPGPQPPTPAAPHVPAAALVPAMLLLMDAATEHQQTLQRLTITLSMQDHELNIHDKLTRQVRSWVGARRAVLVPAASCHAGVAKPLAAAAHRVVLFGADAAGAGGPLWVVGRHDGLGAGAALVAVRAGATQTSCIGAAVALPITAAHRLAAARRPTALVRPARARGGAVVQDRAVSGATAAPGAVPVCGSAAVCKGGSAVLLAGTLCVCQAAGGRQAAGGGDRQGVRHACADLQEAAQLLVSSSGHPTTPSLCFPHPSSSRRQVRRDGMGSCWF